MLFQKRFWAGIAAGDITVAYRRWTRPTVKAGGQLRSPGGLLAIKAVEIVPEASIAEADARAAGFGSVEELRSELSKRSEGELYRIGFRLAERDTRQELRDADALSREEMERLPLRLDRLDRASPHGPWTRAALRLIAEQPGVVSTKLAAEMGRDRASFKLDVRKLKALGLTESLEVGYRLSRRGRAALDRLG